MHVSRFLIGSDGGSTTDERLGGGCFGRMDGGRRSDL